MSPAEPPDEPFPDNADPGPQDPDFIRAMAVLRARAERSKIDKQQALNEWSQTDTDEEILADLGLDMDALRQEP